MRFQDAIRECFAKYAEFNGTASRSEYWWFVLFLILGGAAASVLGDSYLAIFFIATFLPLLAAGSRRLHEAGLSGWLQLIGLVPVAGIIILAGFLAQAPKEVAAVADVTSGEHVAG